MDRKIIVFGASTTWGAWDERGGWVERLKNSESSKTITTNQEYFAIVYNLGISGDTVVGINKRFEAELSRRTNDTDDQLTIIIAVGINDSMYVAKKHDFQVPKDLFRHSLQSINDTARRYTQHVIFIGGQPVIDELLNPIPWHPDGVYATKYIREYNQVTQEFSQNNSAAYIDVFTPFADGQLKELITPDGVHPNSVGHQLIFETVKSGLEDMGLV